MITTLKVTKHNHQWYATTNNPDTFDLFGTWTLPTPYTDKIPKEKVIAALQRLNKGSIVE